MPIYGPGIMLWTSYLSVIYISLFGLFDGYASVFGETYRIHKGITGLIVSAMGIRDLYCICHPEAKDFRLG